MSKPQEILTSFNLSPQETEIYITLLSLGKSGISMIAKKLGKNRAAIYFHIKNLLAKGLVQETRSKTKPLYLGIPPKELGNKLEQHLNEFKGLIPWLESLKKVETEMPIIEVYDSKQGYFHIYEELSFLPVGSMFRVLEGKEALDEEFSLLTQEQWNMFFTRTAHRSIETKGLFTLESQMIPAKRLTKKNIQAMGSRIWHLRLIPESLLPFQQLLFIYGDKIAFMFPRISLTMTIKHRAVAGALMTMFDSLYQFGKPVAKAWK